MSRRRRWRPTGRARHQAPAHPALTPRTDGEAERFNQTSLPSGLCPAFTAWPVLAAQLEATRAAATPTTPLATSDPEPRFRRGERGQASRSDRRNGLGLTPPATSIPSASGEDNVLGNDGEVSRPKPDRASGGPRNRPRPADGPH